MTAFEKTFNCMKKTWVIAVYIVLTVLSYYFIDRSLALYFHQLDIRANMHFLSTLTVLGQWKIYAFLLFFAGVYFRNIRRNSLYEGRSWYLLACVMIPNLFGFVVKIVLGRARPDLLFSIDYFGFYGFKLNNLYWSFPSGHTLTSTALASGLGVIFPRYFYAFLGGALLVASSRILLYHHYLSDVMTGLYMSLLLVGIFTHYFKPGTNS